MLGDLYLLLPVQAREDGIAVDGRVEGILGVCSLVELCRFNHHLLIVGFRLCGCILRDEFLPELQRSDIIIGLSVLSGSSWRFIEILSLLEHVAGYRRFGAEFEWTHHRHRGFHLNFIYRLGGNNISRSFGEGCGVGERERGF